MRRLLSLIFVSFIACSSLVGVGCNLGNPANDSTLNKSATQPTGGDVLLQRVDNTAQVAAVTAAAVAAIPSPISTWAMAASLIASSLHIGIQSLMKKQSSGP